MDRESGDAPFLTEDRLADGGDGRLPSLFRRLLRRFDPSVVLDQLNGTAALGGLSPDPPTVTDPPVRYPEEFLQLFGIEVVGSPLANPEHVALVDAIVLRRDVIEQ